jgi:hypothetical protein
VHPVVFREFDRVCAERRTGGAVLEIGAVPAEDTLLCLPCLRGASSKTGVNIDGPSRFRDEDRRHG